MRLVYIYGITTKLTCRYGAQRNSGQVQQFVMQSAIIILMYIIAHSNVKLNHRYSLILLVRFQCFAEDIEDPQRRSHKWLMASFRPKTYRIQDNLVRLYSIHKG